MMSDLELMPRPATVKRIIEESKDVKSLVLAMNDGSKLDASPGQFVELSVQGYGEATFAISRLPDEDGAFQVSVKKIGHLTRIIHRLAEGETVGIRGPYGKPFPVDTWKGKDLVIIGGGIGLAPLRPVIDAILAKRTEYGKLEVVFGARSPQDILYKDDLGQWEKDTSVTLHTTIDIPFEGWDGRVGFIPTVVKDLGLKQDGRIAVVCGPPIMIKLTADALRDLGWQDDRIYTTLEMKMQCGIGQCGRCNIDGRLICKDGPVFSLDQVPGYAL
jgi:sulfhydrogenase subunit gamma (sulfur reductase)